MSLEMEFHYKQFGMDDDSLQQRAELMSVSFDSLKEIVKSEVTQASGLDLLMGVGQNWRILRHINSFESIQLHSTFWCYRYYSSILVAYNVRPGIHAG